MFTFEENKSWALSVPNSSFLFSSLVWNWEYFCENKQQLSKYQKELVLKKPVRKEQL